MKITSRLIVVVLALAGVALAQDDPQALVKQGQKLSREGKQDEALKLYSEALQKSPNLYDAHLEAGISLDLKGDYKSAREHLSKAIELAPADQKNRALRTMAISYAFEKNAAEEEKYEKQAFDNAMAKSDFEGAAGIANELARLLLESDNINGAEKWYKLGYETALKKTDWKDADKALWEFRWENAQARIAARRGKKADAQKHVQAAKAAFDKAANPQQAEYWPYLTGYVAFYGGDYKTAIAELSKGNQNDPFVLLLLAQAYEKSGDAAKAKPLYEKIMTINFHNPTNAFARPVAKKKV